MASIDTDGRGRGLDGLLADLERVEPCPLELARLELEQACRELMAEEREYQGVPFYSVAVPKIQGALAMVDAAYAAQAG